MATTTNYGWTKLLSGVIDWVTAWNAALDAIDTDLQASVGKLTSYTVATVPDATTLTGYQIYVTYDIGGAVPAFSDGTDWRRCTDRAVVSAT